MSVFSAGSEQEHGMFEVGKRYEIRMIVAGSEITRWETVQSYEHPLVKFADTHYAPDSSFLPGQTFRGEIVNVTSPNFISAVLQDDADSAAGAAGEGKRANNDH